MNKLLIEALCLAWIYIGNVIGIIYMIAYSHIPEVDTFVNWMPLLFSTFVSMILISVYSWNYLLPIQTKRWKIFLGILIMVCQIISVLTLTILNVRDRAKFNDDNTSNDTETMVLIIAIFGMYRGFF